MSGRDCEQQPDPAATLAPPHAHACVSGRGAPAGDAEDDLVSGEGTPAPTDATLHYTLHVNGADRDVADAWLGESLLYVLRERLGLPGTKNACDQGECGSCTVLADGVPVCSCMMLAAAAVGREIVTVEGLGDDGELTDVQQAFVDHGAVQCGFCTPGLIVAADHPPLRQPLTHGPGDPRGHLRKPLPLHRLRPRHRRHHRRRRSPLRHRLSPAAGSTPPCEQTTTTQQTGESPTSPAANHRLAGRQNAD